MKSVIGAVAVALAAVSLSGCGTIIQGTTQDIAVITSPPGGHCDMNRDGEHVAALYMTPGTVTVDKTKDNIVLTCNRPGYQTASFELESGYGYATFGNLIAGGAIGWAIDSADGADNQYPSTANVQFVPLLPGQTPPAQVVYTTAPGSSIPCTREEQTAALLARQNGKSGGTVCF